MATTTAALIGILILITGGQRVEAAFGVFLDSQSALDGREDRP